MSHLNISILAFSTNFCPIKTDLSGNTVWPQASDFQKLAKLAIFGILKLSFVHSKCNHSSLRSQCWMRPFLWFSNTVRVIWLLSFFSCVPNCRIIQHHEKPYQSYCMAAKRIVQGEELTITYTNLLMPTFMRRQKLKENWYFDCACIRLVFFLTLFSFDSNLANVLQVRGSNRIWNLCLCHQVWQQMRKQVITSKKFQHYPQCFKITEKVSFNNVS